MWNKKFWRDTAERVICTVAECALGIIGATSMLEELDPKFILSACAVAALITFLKCVVKATTTEE